MKTTPMHLSALVLISGLLGTVPSVRAQQAAPHATGFAISARLAQSSVQELAASASGSPEFTVGYRGRRISIGVGLGFTRLRVTDRDEFNGDVSESTTTATLFQIGPDILVRIWESQDRRTQGHAALGVAWGRLSATDRDTFTGFPDSESEASGTLIGLRAGVGGEHFLGRNFAIGVEGGFQGTLARDIEEEGVMGQTVSVNAAGAYGALRVTVVLGS